MWSHCIGLSEDECIHHLCSKWPDHCKWLIIWMKKKVRYGLCKMEEDLGNPVPTDPFGVFQFTDWLWPFSNILIQGWMMDLPYDNNDYGLTINTNAVPEKEHYCEKTGPHYNPFGNNHGWMNALDSHVGDLNTFNVPSGSSSASYFNWAAQKPTLWGPFSIIGRSLVVYRNKEMCTPIACCTIGAWKPYWGNPAPCDTVEKDDGPAPPRGLADAWEEPEAAFLLQP